jgi:AcrR family transcriptional regulator
MTAEQRHDQLLEIGRELFAENGFEATSVEEIARHAGVTKPIVYEHFGGKEGLYKAIATQEMQTFTESLEDALASPDDEPRMLVEKATVATLTYIDEHYDGFTILTRDSPLSDPNGAFSSLLGNVGKRVTQLLVHTFTQWKIPAESAPYYAQILIGMVAFTGQWWAGSRRNINKKRMAAYIVNIAWHGLSALDAEPEL